MGNARGKSSVAEKQDKAATEQIKSRLKVMSEENALLKKIIANQAMLLELKEEELRKSKV